MLPNLDRFVLAAEQVEDLRPFEQALACLDIGLVRLPKAEFCFGELVELTQDTTKLPLCLEPVGGKGHRLPEAREHLGKLSLRTERLAKIVVGLGHFRLKADRLP